ncbi:septum formation family protein [Micromonospora sp. NPDC049559]|uniref:septum formation family protein n=1 Tax=Micromonospora sp. NPDC049559 TaxID=3155923 RepID=UPI0034260051
MRRGWRVVCGALVLASLAGCGAPAGTDGDLTDHWSRLPAATQFTPETGTCHPDLDAVGYLSTYTVLDCARPHRTETVYVGRFSGAQADRASAPAADSAELRTVFPECDARVKQFVGGDWRGARMSIRVVPPSPGGWAGGSRWYRCDVFLLNALDGGDDERVVDNTGSLRGVLAKPSPLAYGCFNENQLEQLTPIDCASSHRFEYVGIFNVRADASLDALVDKPDNTYAACYFVISAYVRVPSVLTVGARLGVSFRTPSAEAWARGDRGIRCFLWSDDRALTRSLKNAGPAGLPKP